MADERLQEVRMERCVRPAFRPTCPRRRVAGSLPRGDHPGARADYNWRAIAPSPPAANLAAGGDGSRHGHGAARSDADQPAVIAARGPACRENGWIDRKSVV